MSEKDDQVRALLNEAGTYLSKLTDNDLVCSAGIIIDFNVSGDERGKYPPGLWRYTDKRPIVSSVGRALSQVHCLLSSLYAHFNELLEQARADKSEPTG